MTALEPFLVAAALFAAALVVTSAGLGAGERLRARVWPRRLALSIGPTALAVRCAAPALVSLTVALAVLVPSMGASCHCDAHATHHPHLCVAHPELASALTLPSAIFLVAYAALCAPALARLAQDLRAARRLARTAAAGGLEVVDGVPLRLVDLEGAGAFTVGVLSPVIAVERRLWTALDASARRAIVHHEDAHRSRRDALTLVLLRLLDALSLSRRVPAWRTAAEIACDAHVVEQLGDRFVVARGLVDFARVAFAARPLALAPSAGEELEARVHALVDGDSALPTARACDAFMIVIGSVGPIALALGVLGEPLHHGIETLIGFAFA